MSVADRAGLTGLEVIRRAAPRKVSRPSTPLVFLHGAYAAAWCWDEHFLPFFAAQGRTGYALSFSGHGASAGRERLDRLGIDDYVADTARLVATLPTAPILIGHSMGGMVAQKYLEQYSAAGLVLLASVPPQGLWSSAIGLAFGQPGLMADLNRLLGGGQAALDTLRKALLAQPADAADLNRWSRCLQPESHRALWDMTLFNLPWKSRMQLPPRLVIGAQQDLLIPPAQVEMTARHYDTEAKIFAGMGHGLMLESGWRAVAQYILDWLDGQGL